MEFAWRAVRRHVWCTHLAYLRVTYDTPPRVGRRARMSRQPGGLEALRQPVHSPASGNQRPLTIITVARTNGGRSRYLPAGGRAATITIGRKTALGFVLLLLISFRMLLCCIIVESSQIWEELYSFIEHYRINSFHVDVTFLRIMIFRMSQNNYKGP